MNKVTPLKNVKNGSFIGEREFATNSIYEFSLRAVKFTSIIYIRSEDFMKVIKENPEELERFSMMKDNMVFNSNYKSFGSICEICKWIHNFSK